MTYTIFPPDAAVTSVNWVVTDGAGFAHVSSSGIVTPIAQGAATVTLTLNAGTNTEQSDTITVNVTEDTSGEEPIESVVINEKPKVFFTKISDTAFSPSAASLTYSLFPVNSASAESVLWEVIEGADVVSINSETGLVTPLDTGDAVIKLTINDDETLTDTIIIEVIDQNASANEVEIPFIWGFGVSPGIPGWTAYVSTNADTQAATTMKTDAVYTNGMIITASEIAGEGTTGMRWMPGQSGTNNLTGCLQPNSGTLLGEGKRFIKIENVQGPFTITLTYTDTGSSNSGRFAQLYINGNKVKDGDPTNGTANTRQLEHTYNGNDFVTVEIGASNAIRLYQVKIEKVPVYVSDLTLSSETLTLRLNETAPQLIIAEVAPNNADDTSITWTSSNESVAAISVSGLVTAVGGGTATITATTNGTKSDGTRISRTCTVTVELPIISVSLPSVLDLTVGSSSVLVPVFVPANAANKNVTWQVVSGEAFVSVNNDGLVTALAEGTATVRVTTQDGGRTADCVVTVLPSAGAGQGWINIPLTVTDGGKGLNVAVSSATILKGGTPNQVIFNLTNPVQGHIYTWRIDGQTVSAGVTNDGATLTINAADYQLKTYSVILQMQDANGIWSMPGNLSFTVAAGNSGN